MRKRTLALALSLAMTLGTLPVFAAGEPFTAKVGNTTMTEVSIVENGYVPYAWNGTKTAPAKAVSVYKVTVPKGTKEVSLTFPGNRLAYNYKDGATFLAGKYDDAFTGSNQAKVPVDANDDGIPDYIQVQTPFDQNWKSTTLYAIVFEGSGIRPLPYQDVRGKWYREAAVSAYYDGFMYGVGDGSRFDGESAAKRGLVADAIWRMAGKPEAAAHAGFKDVNEQNPYAKAIDWAAEQGIVKGYGDGRFGVNELVTREQLATMLYRYLKTQGKGFQGEWTYWMNATDRADISEWAREGVSWLHVHKIMTGRTNTTYVPQGTLSRAELATVMVRISEGE